MVDFTAHTRRILSRLGEDVEYSPTIGLPGTVRGVFTAPYAAASIGGFAIGGDRPNFTAVATDMPDLAVGDSLTLRGQDYSVVEIHPDIVAGSVVLILEES